MEPKHTKYMKDTTGWLRGLSPLHLGTLHLALASLCLAYWVLSFFINPKGSSEKRCILLKTFSFIKTCFKGFKNPQKLERRSPFSFTLKWHLTVSTRNLF